MSKRAFRAKGGNIQAASLHQAKLALLLLEKSEPDVSSTARAARMANHRYQLRKERKS